MPCYIRAKRLRIAGSLLCSIPAYRHLFVNDPAKISYTSQLLEALKLAVRIIISKIHFSTCYSVVLYVNGNGYFSPESLLHDFKKCLKG